MISTVDHSCTGRLRDLKRRGKKGRATSSLRNRARTPALWQAVGVMDLRAYRYFKDPAGNVGGSCQPELDAVTLQTIRLTYREAKVPLDAARFLAGALNN